MTAEFYHPFFVRHGKYFSTEQTKNNNASMPFNVHPQFSTMIDVLGRKENHHLVLEAGFPSSMQVIFLETLWSVLSHESIPRRLQNAECIFFNAAYSLPETE